MSKPSGNDTSAKSDVPVNPQRRRFLKYAAAAAVVAGVAVGGGAYYNYVYVPSQKPAAFTLGSSPALTTDVVLLAAKNQGLFEQNKLSPTFDAFPDQNSALVAFAANKFPFHWDGNISAFANSRAKGADVQGIYWATNATNTILVAGNSSYQNVHDLKGKRVGTITLPSTSFILACETWNKNNPNNTLDPLNDFKYSTGGLQLLNQNLLSGNLDAVENVEPFVTLGIQAGARVLTSANDSWNSLTGSPIVGSLMGAQASYATKNSTVTKKLIEVWQEGVSYVKSSDSFVNDFISTTYKLTDSNTINALRQSMLKFYEVQWNDSAVANLGQFLQLLQKYNIVTSIPTNLLTVAYNP